VSNCGSRNFAPHLIVSAVRRGKMLVIFVAHDLSVSNVITSHLCNKLTVGRENIVVLWDVTPANLVDKYQPFAGRGCICSLTN
jgi:hypothetical protein